MKRYFLTALLGVFCLFGFASADTVGNFTSDSTICSVAINGTSVSVNSLSCGEGSMNYCFSTTSSPFYASLFYNSLYVDSAVECFNDGFSVEDADLYFYSDEDSYNDKSVSGTLYISSSPITYSSSSGGSSSSEGILNSTGQAYLSNVLSGVQSVVIELIPYMVYLALAILVATLGFIAIKWLMNYTSRRVTGLFSSRRRK